MIPTEPLENQLPEPIASVYLHPHCHQIPNNSAKILLKILNDSDLHLNIALNFISILLFSKKSFLNEQNLQKETCCWICLSIYTHCGFPHHFKI